MIDRSMNRAEYYHWRKITRETRHLRPPVWWNMADPTPSREVRAAANARVARQLCIEMRVHRNKARLGIR